MTTKRNETKKVKLNNICIYICMYIYVYIYVCIYIYILDWIAKEVDK